MERSIRIPSRSPADSPFSQDPVHFRPAERLLAAAVGPAVASARPRRAPGRRPGRRLHLQAGRRLLLSVRDRQPGPARPPRPPPPTRSPESRYLCFSLRPALGAARGSSALGGRRDTHTRVGVSLLNAKGATVRRFSIPAQVKRPSSLKLVLDLAPGRAGLRPHRYRWRVIENRGGCRRCRASLPAAETRLFRLRPVRVVGCTGGGAGLVTHGPRDRDAIALTFDDGPSYYTAAFLDVLREKHVVAHLLRDRPGDRRPRGDDAAPPARRQRDRQPHDPPSTTPATPT